MLLFFFLISALVFKGSKKEARLSHFAWTHDHVDLFYVKHVLCFPAIVILSVAFRNNKILYFETVLSGNKFISFHAPFYILLKPPLFH